MQAAPAGAILESLNFRTLVLSIVKPDRRARKGGRSAVK
jgi:hypothetical protein